MIKDFNLLIEMAVAGIREHAEVVVGGLSGGVDSLVTLGLCKLALGAHNVYAVHLPHNSTDLLTEHKFNANSVAVAEMLGIKSLHTNVFDASKAINDSVRQALEFFPGVHEEGAKLNPVNEGNARSRARMCTLYGIAHELNTRLNKAVRVVGTGNLSEDFIGYDTKGGDALCDFFPIGELYKSEVYQLAEWMVEQGMITKEMIDYTPSAGLWDGQSDEEELGHTYDEMQPAIESLRAKDGSCKPTDDAGLNAMERFVYDRHQANKHKHEAPPVIKLREYLS